MDDDEVIDYHKTLNKNAQERQKVETKFLIDIDFEMINSI